MKKLNNTYDTPASGFTYTQPETMEKFHSRSIRGLISKIKQHRIINNIPIGSDFVAEVENEVCSTLPPLYWSYVDEKPHERSKYKTMGLSDIVAGTSNLVKWFIGGCKRVSFDVAESRAAICAKCQDNKKVSGCFSCGLRELVVQVTEEQKTSHNSDLGACMNCQCSIRALVWIEQDFYNKTLTEEEVKNYPSYCWKIKDRNNENKV